MMHDNERKKILIIKFSALGDIVLATPHINVLMRHHVNDDVYLLTYKHFTQLFSAFDFQETWSIVKGDQRAFLGALYKVFKAKFDVVYDLQSNDRSALLVLFSRAVRRIGMGHRKIYTHHEESRDYSRHTFIRMNDLFKSLGLSLADEKPVIGSTIDTRQKIKQWLDGKNIGNFVIFHAGSSPRWLSKRWPAQYFVTLAAKINELGVAVIWIGAKDEIELNRELSSRIGVDATNQFSFQELVELGRHASLAVVNDSGPMHLLAASGIPVFGIFGPTNYQRSHAVGQLDNVLLNPVFCSPCYLEVCPVKNAHACMNGLLPETVFEKVVNYLEQA